MSKQDLIKVVQRSINDAAFRRQLTTDTANALRGYSLTPDEVGALRSRDAGKLTAFGVDTRMSKIFTIDQGAMGSATVTSGSEPRDVAPVWTGDGAAHGAVQSPDSAERNAMIIGDPTLSITGAVQSPDAADRNAAYTAADETQSGGVQSPDAADRNLASIIPSGVHNTEPVWTGDLGAGNVAPVEGSPEQSAFDAANTAGGAEPRDSEPTWIGDNQPAEHAGGDDTLHQQ